MKRGRVSKRQSKKLFRKTAASVHKKNRNKIIYRGGTRL